MLCLNFWWSNLTKQTKLPRIWTIVWRRLERRSYGCFAGGGARIRQYWCCFPTLTALSCLHPNTNHPTKKCTSTVTWWSSCWQQHLTHPNLALCTMTNEYKHHRNPNYPFHDERYQSSCANYCVIGNVYSASSIIILVHSLPELPPAHSDSNYQTRGQTPSNTLPSIRSVLDLRSTAQDIYGRNKRRRE